MSLTIYIVSAFCRNGVGGNRAGVVLEEDLEEVQMQKIAADLNFSETVFLSKESDVLYEAKYFTPNSPIDFCGHATLAAFGLLKELGKISEGFYQIKTQMGTFNITVENELIFLSQKLPVFGEEIKESEVCEVLGGNGESILMKELKPQIVSTGLRDLIVAVKDKKILFSLKPDFEKMIFLSKKYNIIGVHVFCMKSIQSVFCRNFAPLYGILEESATGSSNGALSCYLFKEGLLFPSKGPIVFKQGDVLALPSDIHIRLESKKKEITRVECGGEVKIESIKRVK